MRAGAWRGVEINIWPGICCRTRSVGMRTRRFDRDESLGADLDLVGEAHPGAFVGLEACLHFPQS